MWSSSYTSFAFGLRFLPWSIVLSNHLMYQIQHTIIIVLRCAPGLGPTPGRWRNPLWRSGATCPPLSPVWHKKNNLTVLLLTPEDLPVPHQLLKVNINGRHIPPPPTANSRLYCHLAAGKRNSILGISPLVLPPTVTWRRKRETTS